MQIIVNGENRDLTADTTVAALLNSLALNAKLVVVQCNEDIVERAAFSDTLLTDGDVLEIVRFVGGG